MLIVSERLRLLSRLDLQLPNKRLIPIQHIRASLLASRFKIQVERAWLQNNMAVGRLRVDVHRLAGPWADLGAHVESPEHAGTEAEHLVVNNVVAQTGAAAPAKGVHALALAEVREPAQRLLVRGPAGLEPALRAEGLGVWVLGFDAVDAPTFVLERPRGLMGMEGYHSQARIIVPFFMCTPRYSSSFSA